MPVSSDGIVQEAIPSDDDHGGIGSFDPIALFADAQRPRLRVAANQL
jgi:hypothetical protein